MGSACCQTQDDKSQPLMLDESDDDQTNDSEYPYQATVLYDYVGVDDDQLTINHGEIVIITDDSFSLNGWAIALNDNYDEGYIPKEYVKSIDANKEWKVSKQCRIAMKLMEDYNRDQEEREPSVLIQMFDKVQYSPIWIEDDHLYFSSFKGTKTKIIFCLFVPKNVRPIKLFLLFL